MHPNLNKYMMRLRLESKEAENRGKPPLVTPDVEQTQAFTFSPIMPLDRVGDSGPLLLAKRKSNRSERYLVKHAYTDCACNEFIYTKLAVAMGYSMPDAVLFQFSPGEKRRYFKTEYIIGLRYLDLEIESPTYEEIRARAVNWQQFFSFRALYAIFNESDSFETPLAADGKLYRIDTTDAFPTSCLWLDDAGINFNFDGKNPQEIRKHQLLSSDLSGALVPFVCDIYRTSCLSLDKDSLSYYLDPFARIQEISDDYIDDFLNTLCYFYPDFIGDFFKRYISALQEQCAAYLKENR